VRVTQEEKSGTAPAGDGAASERKDWREGTGKKQVPPGCQRKETAEKELKAGASGGERKKKYDPPKRGNNGRDKKPLVLFTTYGRLGGQPVFPRKGGGGRWSSRGVS